MRLFALGLGALLLALASVSSSHGQHYPPMAPVAPDACGGGWYNSHHCGMVYGPNHWLRPAWEPFNGFVPPVGRSVPGGGGNGGGNGGGLPAPPNIYNFRPAPAANGLPESPLFPTHPYARSPRDYFMID